MPALFRPVSEPYVLPPGPARATESLIVRMRVSDKPKCGHLGPEAFLLSSKKANFVLLRRRCNLLGEMFGFVCQIIESQIWGSRGISKEKVSNHKLIEQGNKVTKEMFHCA